MNFKRCRSLRGAYRFIVVFEPLKTEGWGVKQFLLKLHTSSLTLFVLRISSVTNVSLWDKNQLENTETVYLTLPLAVGLLMYHSSWPRKCWKMPVDFSVDICQHCIKRYIQIIFALCWMACNSIILMYCILYFIILCSLLFHAVPIIYDFV